MDVATPAPGPAAMTAPSQVRKPAAAMVSQVRLNKFDWMYLTACRSQELKKIKQQYAIDISVTKTFKDDTVQLTIKGPKLQQALIALGGLQSDVTKTVTKSASTVPGKINLERVDKLIAKTSDYLIQRVHLTVHIVGTEAQIADGKQRLQKCLSTPAEQLHVETAAAPQRKPSKTKKSVKPPAKKTPSPRPVAQQPKLEQTPPAPVSPTEEEPPTPTRPVKPIRLVSTSVQTEEKKDMSVQTENIPDDAANNVQAGEPTPMKPAALIDEERQHFMTSLMSEPPPREETKPAEPERKEPVVIIRPKRYTAPPKRKDSSSDDEPKEKFDDVYSRIMRSLPRETEQAVKPPSEGLYDDIKATTTGSRQEPEAPEARVNKDTQESRGYEHSFTNVQEAERDDREDDRPPSRPPRSKLPPPVPAKLYKTRRPSYENAEHFRAVAPENGSYRRGKSPVHVQDNSPIHSDHDVSNRGESQNGQRSPDRLGSSSHGGSYSHRDTYQPDTNGEYDRRRTTTSYHDADDDRYDRKPSIRDRSPTEYRRQYSPDIDDRSSDYSYPQQPKVPPPRRQTSYKARGRSEDGDRYSQGRHSGREVADERSRIEHHDDVQIKPEPKRRLPRHEIQEDERLPPVDTDDRFGYSYSDASHDVQEFHWDNRPTQRDAFYNSETRDDERDPRPSDDRSSYSSESPAPSRRGDGRGAGVERKHTENRATAEEPSADYLKEPVKAIPFLGGRQVDVAYRWIYTDTVVYITEADITNAKMDAIISPGNRTLNHTDGLAKHIADAAGFDLSKECHTNIAHGGPLPVGGVFMSGGHGLHSEHVIHVVQPVFWDYGGEFACFEALYEAYFNALWQAEEARLRTVAVPAISQGEKCGVPLHLVSRALDKALQTFLKGSKYVESIAIIDKNREFLSDISAKVEEAADRGFIKVDIVK